jgi:two-component system, chemotaxis family, CheB/CheR fusion protein
MSMSTGTQTVTGRRRARTTIALLEYELSELRLFLERYAGVLLDLPNDTLVARIVSYVEAHHLNAASELLAVLGSSANECDALLEILLAAESGFYRHPAAFESFARKVLPELEQRKSGDSPRTLRIWSAGCSTGEEAYSIAMAVCQQVSCCGGGWNIHILASDIRRAALQIAERGLYPREALAQVPRPLIKDYFVKVGEHLLAKPRLRNLVTFTPMNLACAHYLGRFDCIFCMDVLPHFSVAQKNALVERLHLYLEPGGYLLLGDSEKIPSAAELSFQCESQPRFTLCRKALAAKAKAGK